MVFMIIIGDKGCSKYGGGSDRSLLKIVYGATMSNLNTLYDGWTKN